VDVRDDYNMDVDAFERAVTPKTKAVIPVHLNGRMADMTRIMRVAERERLIVIEDAAQALGATVDGRRAGSIGLTGCFSFYPFKILGCFGDGGAVTTNDPDVACAVGRLRYNGEDRETGEYHFHGYTALLDNVQAAVLDVKLRRLPGWIEHRRRCAVAYRRGLGGVGDLRLPHFDGDRFEDVFQNYVVRTARRDEFRAFLRESGVETLLHWPKPVWEHRALGLPDPGLPETLAICREVLSLPMSAETTMEHVDIVVDAARRFYS
jgi:dTDP-4-amino-4,6-dideoxygalactose transaminase